IFMMQAVGSSVASAQSKLATLDAEAADHVRMTAGQLQQFLQMGIPLANLARFGMLSKPVEDLRKYQLTLLQNKKTDAARLVGKIAGSYALMEWEVTHPGELYFGGVLTPDGLLDFQIWRKQADALNITLTDEDMRKAVNAEADSDVLTGDPNKDADKVALYLRGQFRTVEPKAVYNALREEFRVRMAKEVLLGSAGGARPATGGGLAGNEVPGEGTPDEFWDYYKDNLTTLKATFLKLPVKQFIAEVKAQPSQQELEDLYRRYKSDEPNPERPTPGFKVPRKVKVEWVAADPESPHYREAADKVLPALGASGPLALLPFPAAGAPAGAAGAAAQMAAGSLWNVPQQFEYLSYLKGIKSWWDAGSVTPEPNSPYATGLRRPDGVASVTGQLVGSSLSATLPWGAATLGAVTEVRLAEQKSRQAAMVLAAANPFPLSVAAQEAALADVPVPTEAAVRADLAARLRNRLGPEMADAVMTAFVKGLEAKRFNPNEAADYVKQNANIEHGITAGPTLMGESRDEYTIADDPALAPLRATAEKGNTFTPTDRRRFSDQFFTTAGADGRPTQTQPYQPRPITDVRTRATYYWWLTDSEKPKTRSFTEAKADVEAAWKLIQARKLAREAADRIVADMKKRGEGISGDRFLKDEAERLKAAHPGAGFDTFDLIGVSRLKRPDQPFLAANRYEPYNFPETTIAYPRPDTVDELMTKLKEPGDSLVFTDRPERIDYVAVLEDRKVPSEKDFFDVYKHAPPGIISDSLWARFQAEREQKYRAAVVRHLRAEALAPLDDQGNYKIDPDVRKRIRGGPGEE
ncbi:MAG TPA: hypothetical protein VFW33_01100, partial [Gemmataceae bacterium]|nr:hypothetical protein [Gemmataceae bacterium]